MDRPITKKTALCLALAASLAFFGNYVTAGYVENSDGSYTYTNDEATLPSDVFTSTGTYSPASGVTIEITGGETTSTLTGVWSSTNSYEIDGDIKITITGSNVPGQSGLGFTGLAISSGSNIITGDVIINISDSTISNGLYGVRHNNDSTSDSSLTVGDITITLDTVTTTNNIVGLLLDSGITNSGTTSVGNISIKAKNVDGDGFFYGYTAAASIPSGSSIIIESITMDVSGMKSDSGSGRTVAGVYKQEYSTLIIGEEGMTGNAITITATDSAAYTVYGIYSMGGNVTINGDISVMMSSTDESSSSSANGLVYGAYLAGGDTNGVKFTTKNISVEVDNSAINSGSVYGVHIYGNYEGDVTFTADGDITITMNGDSTSARICGYIVETGSAIALTSSVGNITLNIKEGAEEGNLFGYYSSSGITSDSLVTIESIKVTVSSLDVGTTEGAVNGVFKQDDGSLTINNGVTVDVSSASGTAIRGVFSDAGAVKITGAVSVTTSNTTDSNVYGVYIGGNSESGSSLDMEGNIILTLTDLNMPSTETTDNIEGFRFDGKSAILKGDISITAIADPNISGDGFDHDIIGAAIPYTNDSGTVTQTGNITITLGGDNADLKLAGTIYGLVVASGSATYSLSGTTKLVFGTSDAPFVSNESSSALTATFANFKEVVISNGSSLFIDPDIQDKTLTADADIFGGNDPANYVTDIHSEGGTLTLSAEDNKLTIESGGQAYIDELVVSQKSGTVADEGDLTITRGSNSGTISGNGKLVLGTPTDTSKTFVSTGTIDIPEFILGASATLDEQEGTVTVKTKADLTAAGFMAVGAKATAELNVSGDINAQVSVLGKMAIGTPDSFAWTDDALSAAGITADSNILALKSLVTTGSTGYISVGGGTSVLDSASASSTPGLNFGSDSVLLIDAGLLTADSTSSSAFTTTASGATVTVDSGGTVVLYGSVSKGRYNITSGYDFGSDIEGWYKPTIDDSDDYVKVVDPSGITWNYYRGSDEQDGTKYVFIELTSHDPSSENYPDVNVPNILDDELDNCGDDNYLCGVIRDTDLTNDEKTNIINSSSTLLFDGGVTAVSRDGAGTAIDHLFNHLTMDSDTFDKDAKLWQYEESENIWIDVMGNWSKAKSLFTATGLSHFGYRNHSYGFITGWDHKFEDRPFVLGVAFSFDKGNLKSRGSVSQTKNLYKDYGIHIFGNYSENEHLNLIGSLHWLHNNSGVTQATGVSDFSKVSGSMHTNTFAAGLRAETMIKAGDINVIPHVEARYMYGKTRAFDTKVNGTKVWRTKADGTHTLQIPFGVAFRTDKKYENGWNVRPNLDLQAIPQIGNTKQKTVVTNFNGVSDVIVGQFAGKWAGQARIGVQADKKNATLGAHYSFLGANKGRAGHTFMVQGRVRF